MIIKQHCHFSIFIYSLTVNNFVSFIDKWLIDQFDLTKYFKQCECGNLQIRSFLLVSILYSVHAFYLYIFSINLIPFCIEKCLTHGKHFRSYRLGSWKNKRTAVYSNSRLGLYRKLCKVSSTHSCLWKWWHIVILWLRSQEGINKICVNFFK